MTIIIRRLLLFVVVFPMISLAQRASQTLTDYQLMKRNINLFINHWLRKGEFEKSKDHEARIKNNWANAFDSICYEAVQLGTLQKGEITVKLLTYNADTEKFPVRFQLGNTIWQDSLPVPLNKAPQFKDNSPMSVAEVDLKDWVFVNGQLTPSKVTIKNRGGSFTWQSISAGAKEIEFVLADIGIGALAGKNLTFRLAEYYLKAPLQITSDEIITSGDYSKSEEKVFEKVEIEASVNVAQWRRHLENQLPRYIENAVSSGMAPGNYTVNVRFLVDKDGSVFDIKALNNPGYGLAQGPVEVVKRGPRWMPGEQGGRKVRSYHTQPITFQIQEQ